MLAAIVRLLETTYIRVGSEEYARTNKSYGSTTMRNRRVKIRGSKMQSQFKGKRGVKHSIDLSDAKLARIVKSCGDLPGYELFYYAGEDGMRSTVEHLAEFNIVLCAMDQESESPRTFVAGISWDLHLLQTATNSLPS